MARITKENAEIIGIMSNIILKFILGIGAFVLLCVIIAAMLKDGNTYNKLMYGGLSGILTGCIYLPFKHFFPSVNKNRTNKKP